MTDPAPPSDPKATKYPQLWRLFGKAIFVRYGWGWDLKLPFGFFLVSTKGGLYVSDDATPPCRAARSVETGLVIPGNRGRWIWRRSYAD